MLLAIVVASCGSPVAELAAESAAVVEGAVAFVHRNKLPDGALLRLDPRVLKSFGHLGSLPGDFARTDVARAQAASSAHGVSVCPIVADRCEPGDASAILTLSEVERERAGTARIAVVLESKPRDLGDGARTAAYVLTLEKRGGRWHVVDEELWYVS